MLKRAYQIGVQLALKEAGLLKVGQGFAQQGIAQAVRRQQWGQPASAPVPPSPAKTPAAPIRPPVPPPVPKPAGPSMLGGIWGEMKSSLLSPPPSQLAMRRSNIESRRRRLRRL